jgi:ParB-like chromosome segregation protein Spo0J
MLEAVAIPCTGDARGDAPAQLCLPDPLKEGPNSEAAAPTAEETAGGAAPGAKPAESLRRLDDLRPHPRQADLFDNLPDGELKALAEDIKANGLKVRPDVLPDGTVVNGHQRCRVFRLLGREEVPVRVRYDWVALGKAQVERRLIEDNLHRRHLDKLGVARCAKRLFEIEKTKGGRELHAWERGDVRDRVARRLKFGSGKNLQRYLHILEAPIEVQRAFSAGEVKLLPAVAVAGLPKEAQAKIAEQIRSGGKPGEVVGRYLPKKPGRHAKVSDAFAAFTKALERGLDDLDGRLGLITCLRPEVDSVLRRAMKCIWRIHRQAKVVTPEQAAARCRELLEGLKGAAADALLPAAPDTLSGLGRDRGGQGAPLLR